MMKRIKVNLRDISDLDLKLAKNPQVPPLIEQIIRLTPEERERQLKALQKKIDDGAATLFEERVHVKLFEPRKAEWIRVIYKNLPRIEKELQKSSPSLPEYPQSPSTRAQTAPPAPAIDEYPSELLNFLATQKPPTPPKSSGRQAAEAQKSSPRRYIKNISLGLLLIGAFVLSVWYVLASEQETPPPATFDNVQTQQQREPGMSDELAAQVQAQFDDAFHALRFGDFEQGKQGLLDLIEQYPDSSYAREGYMLLADLSRQRQNNPDEAIKYYQAFLDVYPDNAQTGIVMLKMGYAYEDLQDPINAKEMYRLLIESQGTKSRLGQLAQGRLATLSTQGNPGSIEQP